MEMKDKVQMLRALLRDYFPDAGKINTKINGNSSGIFRDICGADFTITSTKIEKDDLPLMLKRHIYDISHVLHSKLSGLQSLLGTSSESLDDEIVTGSVQTTYLLRATEYEIDQIIQELTDINLNKGIEDVILNEEVTMEGILRERKKRNNS